MSPTSPGNLIQIVEVGLRDGLQNEKTLVSTDDRVTLAEKFVHAGVTRLELGSFVRPDWVPQMAGSKEVIQKFYEFKFSTKVLPSALVPNKKGMEEALSTLIGEVAIFGACSESFSQKNINCSIEESFSRFAEVMDLAKKSNLRVRGYLSTCFGCPYEGPVDQAVVIRNAKRMIDMGCFEVSIGDTIGVGNPAQVDSIFTELKLSISAQKLAGHFHDTRGTALANILTAYHLGIRTFDCSLGGLGGCPYAPGAAGNVATEDVVYMFEQMGLHTGIDLKAMIQANHWMSGIMKKELYSKVSKAGLPTRSIV